MAPNRPIPFPPNDPIPCKVIADPPFEVTANLNSQQIANITAWVQEQVNLALADACCAATPQPTREGLPTDADLDTVAEEEQAAKDTAEEA